MTENEMKLWLNRAYYANSKKVALQAYIETLKNRLTDVSVSYEKDGKSESKGNNTENKYMRYLEKKQKLDEEIEKLENVTEEIEKAIFTLNNDDLEAVLIDRYLNFYSQQKTAEHLNYSIESVKKKQKQAVLYLCANFTP